MWHAVGSGPKCIVYGQIITPVSVLVCVTIKRVISTLFDAKVDLDNSDERHFWKVICTLALRQAQRLGTLVVVKAGCPCDAINHMNQCRRSWFGSL